MTLSLKQRLLVSAILMLVVPLFVLGQTDRDNAEADTTMSDSGSEVETANHNNTRSNRSSVAAPEELATTTDDTTDATTTDRAQNHNSSRSNRTQPVAVDTNLCDGVTCADGSCAATVDECPLAADRVPTASCPRGGEDCDDTDSEVRPDGADSDQSDDGFDFTAPPIIIDAPGAEVQSAAGDDCDDTDDCRRPDATRSAETNDQSDERAEPDYLDDDDDGDGVPTGSEGDSDVEPQATLLWRGGQLERTDAPNGSAAADDRVRCWGKGEDATGTVHSWGDGLCVSLPEDARATATIKTAEIPTLRVDGAAVRAWNVTERQSWQVFVDSRENPTPFEQLSAELVRATQADARILDMKVGDGGDPDESISIAFTPVIVRYQAPMNLFGFIPMEREVLASIDDDGAVTVDYPWYSFLATKPANADIQTLLERTRAILAGE